MSAVIRIVHELCPSGGADLSFSILSNRPIPAVFLHGLPEQSEIPVFLNLADAAAKEMYDALNARFDTYAADLSRDSETVNQKQTDKDRKAEMLMKLKKTRQEIQEQLQDLKGKIGQLP